LSADGKCIGECRQFLDERIVRAAELPNGRLKSGHGLGRKARCPSTLFNNLLGLLFGGSDNSSRFEFSISDDPLSEFMPLDHSPFDELLRSREQLADLDVVPSLLGGLRDRPLKTLENVL